MIKGVAAKSASVHTIPERLARRQAIKTGGRRTVHEDRIAPPIDWKAPFGQLEREENSQQRQYSACS